MRELPLSKGKVALVDDEDYEWLSRRRWYFQKNGYAIGHVNRKTIYLHRQIMGEPEGLVIDHINRDKLDCRKCNLRIATQQQNHMNACVPSHNTSGYKGVSFYRRLGKWQAFIKVQRRFVFLGYHGTPEAAAEAYNRKAQELYGEFALLNDIRRTA